MSEQDKKLIAVQNNEGRQTEMESAVHYDNEDMNKAAYYMSSKGGRDWQKGAEYADKVCGMGEKQPYIASIFCHKKIAEELMEQGELAQASGEWKTVFDRVISVREDLNKEVYQLKDFEQKFIDMAQDDSLYGMALVMYIGLLERDETQDKEFIVKNMVAGLEYVDTPKAKLLLGLGYDRQNKRKQAAKLLRNVIETTDYAEQEKESYEELAYFHGVVCLAFYYRDGIPNYIEKNSRQAVATLENGINSVTSENLKQALMEQRKKYTNNANAEQTSMATLDRDAVHDKDEFVMGNGVVYSRNRMEKSVDMCANRVGLKRVIQNAENSLKAQYPTDEEYLKNNLWTWWDGVKVFGMAVLTVGLVLGVIFTVLSWIFRFKVTPALVTIDWILIIGISLFAAIYYYKENNEGVMNSDDFRKLREERDWRDTHIPDIKRLIEQSKTELTELEQTMNDRNKCIIPQTYWGVAGYLWSYIENGRANNLTEAINLHEDLQHKATVEGILTDISQTAQRTQSIMEDAGYEAAQAHLAADRAASYAEDARFWSMLNYYSNR